MACLILHPQNSEPSITESVLVSSEDSKALEEHLAPTSQLKAGSSGREEGGKKEEAEVLLLMCVLVLLLMCFGEFSCYSNKKFHLVLGTAMYVTCYMTV